MDEIFMPPYFAHVGWLVGMSVSLNLMQPITQERFTPKTSNLLGT